MSTFYYKTVYELNAEGGMTLIERSHPFEWNGPVAQCKKGREQQQQITQAQIKQMADQAAQQKLEQAAADRTIGTFETQGQPGQLSPAAAAQLASDTDNINRTYNGMRQTAFANLGARGFGSAPSGFSLGTQNAINLEQAKAGTGAFRNAQVNTQNLLDRALQARMGLSKDNLQGTNQAANTASNSAYLQSKQGSLLGDIGQGIAAGAGLINPIAGVGGAFKSAFRNLGTYSGSSVPASISGSGSY